jgi:hypothetical protein
MLAIYPKQLEELEKHCRLQANIKLAEYAAKRFPANFKDLAPERLLTFVDKVRSQAEKYEFEKEVHVATFLDLLVMYGDDFPKSEWAAPTLAAANLSPDAKITLLRQIVEASGVKL